MPKPKMMKLPTTVNLPAPLQQAIGRVMIEYAELDHEILELAYKAAGINPKLGREIFKKMKLKDYPSTIRNIMRIRGKKFTSKFPQGLESISDRRNWLAHGVWVISPKTKNLQLRIVQGTWDTTPPRAGRTSRRLDPQAKKFGIKDCRKLCSDIRKARKRLNVLSSRISSLLKKPS